LQKHRESDRIKRNKAGARIWKEEVYGKVQNEGSFGADKGGNGS